MLADNRSMEQVQWFTRYGTEYKPHTDTKHFHVAMLGAPARVLGFVHGPIYDADPARGTAKYNYDATCSRCGGAGGSDKWAHTGWTCFQCGGSGKGGVHTGKLYTAEKLVKLNATQQKRNAALKVKRDAAQLVQQAAASEARQAFYLANRELVTGLSNWAEVPGNLDHSSFLLEMWQTLEQNGQLTDGQMAATQKWLDSIKARAAARAASQFIGEVGKRMEFTLVIERIIKLEAQDNFSRGGRYQQWALPTIYLCRDDQGNRVVYKGSSALGAKGETIRLKATVEAHDTYKDENQTKIARPKVLGVLDTDTGKFMTWDGKAGALVEAVGVSVLPAQNS